MASDSVAVVGAAAGQRKTVLHLVGSRQDSFYYDLSVLYARACDGCEELDRSRYEFRFAVVGMDD
eukprot:7834272-Pyramimonas_sp.AAC.1